MKNNNILHNQSWGWGTHTKVAIAEGFLFLYLVNFTAKMHCVAGWCCCNIATNLQCQNCCKFALCVSRQLVFGRKPELLLDLETNPDIKVSGTFKDYCMLLNKTLQFYISY